MVINPFTSVLYLSLYRVKSIQSMPLIKLLEEVLVLSYQCLGPPSGLFPSCFPTKTLYVPLLSPLHATCPVHVMLIELITRIKYGEEQRSLRASLCSFLHSAVISSLLGPIILLSTLFSNTLNLRSSLNASDHVTHPYKTTGKIIVLYILTL